MTISTLYPFTSISKLHEAIVNACKAKGLEIPDIISTTEKLCDYIELTSDEFETYVISSICMNFAYRKLRAKDNWFRFVDSGFGNTDMHIEDGSSEQIYIEPETKIQNGSDMGLKDLHPILQENIFKSIYEWRRLCPEYKGHLEDCYIEEGYPLWFKFIGSAEDVVRVYREAADIVQLDLDDLLTKAGIPDEEKDNTKRSIKYRFELSNLEPFYRRICLARVLGLL